MDYSKEGVAKEHGIFLGEVAAITDTETNLREFNNQAVWTLDSKEITISQNCNSQFEFHLDSRQDEAQGISSKEDCRRAQNLVSVGEAIN